MSVHSPQTLPALSPRPSHSPPRPLATGQSSPVPFPPTAPYDERTPHTRAPTSSLRLTQSPPTPRRASLGPPLDLAHSPPAVHNQAQGAHSPSALRNSRVLIQLSPPTKVHHGSQASASPALSPPRERFKRRHSISQVHPELELDAAPSDSDDERTDGADSSAEVDTSFTSAGSERSEDKRNRPRRHSREEMPPPAGRSQRRRSQTLAQIPPRAMYSFPSSAPLSRLNPYHRPARPSPLAPNLSHTCPPQASNYASHSRRRSANLPTHVDPSLVCPSPWAEQKRRDREEALRVDDLRWRQKVAADRARQVARQVQSNAALRDKLRAVAEVNSHYAATAMKLTAALSPKQLDDHLEHELLERPELDPQRRAKLASARWRIGERLAKLDRFAVRHEVESILEMISAKSISQGTHRLADPPKD